MRGTVLILLCALALAQAYSSQRNGNGRTCNCNSGDAKEVCAPLGTDGLFVAHEHCNRFYQCYNGVPVTFECPANLLYNVETQVCDWPENVDCGDRPIVEEEAEDCDGDTDEDSDEVKDNSSNQDAGTDNGGSDNGIVGGGNTDPSEAPAICAAEDSDGILIAHENCNGFYKCFHGLPVEFKCGGNLLFNPNNDQCDWPENVECGDRIVPDADDNGSSCDGSCDNGGSDNGGNDNGGSDNGGSDNGGSDNGGSDNGGSDNGSVGGGNCDPSEAPTICAADQSEGVLVAHENCNYFYKCSYGLPVEYKCPVNLLFNPSLDQCDWPENVDCGDRVIPDGEDNSCSGNESGCDNGGSDNGASDNGGSDNGGSDNGGSDNGGSDNGPVGGGNCDPSEAPTICADDGSEGVLVAHENCNYFYKCSYGLPVEYKCPVNLLFNPSLDQCDWPENVDCGDRVIPDGEDNSCSGNESGCDNGGSDNGGSDNGGSDNGGSDNGGSDNGGSDNGGSDNGPVGGGNCDPSEAPAICAADESEGVLVAHEKCNYFYKCSGGLPVELICPGNLLFNPITDQCDWPENVQCGDRAIPEEGDNDGSDNGGSDNGGSDNGGSDNGGSDNGGSDNGGSDSGGSDNGPVGGGNSDPSEAPAICAADQSEGVLVAHENCNYFYKCSFGLPVEFKCPVNLLFNPDKDQCDWPENVECGDRVIPDYEDNSCSGNDSGCDNGGSDNGGSDNGGSDNGGSDNGGSDNGGSDNGGSDNGAVGGGNCDPSEAPAICAADQSEGVLVAHENCNYFYKCANGLPIAFKCPGNLLFNPNIDQCDWPVNVECGDRVIPDEEDNSCSGNDSGCDNGGSDNGGSDNGGSDNGGSDNGGIDNGGSDNGPVGGGNCDPSEAPTICAADESDGVLIAHEHCNYFYKCANGLPIAFKCPGNLLFNPNIDQCDWPVNVECGDRFIPDEDDNSCSGNDSGCDNGGSDNSGSDNGSGDNGGSDNGGNDNGGSDNGGSDNGGSDNGGSDNGAIGGCNCDPSEAPAICAADDSEGVLVAHENCNYFYKCSFGLPVEYKCPVNLLFNPHTDQCDWPENVDCGDRVIPDESNNDGSDNGGSDNGGSDNGGSDNGGSDNGGSDNGGTDNGGSDNGGSDNGPVGGGNCDPSEAPAICAADESEGVLVAHEKCNYFYKCSGGLPVELICPGNLLFNPITDQCDWPENVECGDRIIPDETDNGGSDNGGSDNGGSDNGGSDNGGTDNGGSDNGSVGGGNCDPSQAPSICAADESEGVLVAHENCNYFYKCSFGLPVEYKCPLNLLFNPHTDQCDWPENVDCGDRVIPDESDNGGSDNGDSDNGGSDNGGSDNGGTDNGGSDNETVGGGNCDPSEAPTICAADQSEGVLVAHEKCNYFYKCSSGLPVELICPGNLLFEPSTDQCDWPENVDCGDRIVPVEGESDGTDNGGSDNGDSDNGGSDNGGSDNGGSDNGGSDNGGSDNGDSDNGGSDTEGGVNDNPSLAPSICASAGTEGVFIAHEECNKYYMCINGVPVPVQCSGTLMFNPLIGVCDWPRNVDCGDRIVPETDDSGTCNCNFRQAPSICIADGSNGKMIVHEECNKFFVCSEGVPVPRSCPRSLLYDPMEEACKRAQDVSCEDRVLHYSLDKHIDSRLA